MVKFSKYTKAIYRKIQKSVGAISLENSLCISRKEVFGPEVFDVSTKTDVDGNFHKYFMGYQMLVPSAYIYSVENSRLINGREELFAANYSVYEELTTQLSNPGKHLCRRDFGKELRLHGSVLSLSLSGLENNYYHFLVEFLARWWLFKQSEIEADWIVFPVELAFQAQMIEILGIDPRKIVAWKGHNSLYADKIIFPSFINNYRLVPCFLDKFNLKFNYRKEWLPTWLPSLYSWIGDRVEVLDAEAAKDCRKIYISRSKALTRKIINEVDLCSALVDLDFSILDCSEIDVAHQITIFSRAKMIIAPHGAGLANVLFSRTKVSVLELHPDLSYQDPSHWLSCCLMGHDYSYIIGDPRIFSSTNPKDRDFEVNVKKVIAWVKNHD